MNTSANRDRTFWAAVAVVAVAASLRLWDLADVPSGLWYDEAAYAIDALFVARDGYPLYFVGNQGREPLFIYGQAISVRLMGLNPIGVRFLPVAVALLSIALAYPLVRAMFSTRVALITIALAAASLWHLVISRLAMRASLLPFLLVLTASLLWLALRRHNYWLSAAAGAVLGLSLYSYTAARAAPVWLAAFWLIWLTVPRWRLGVGWRRALALAAVFWLAAATVAGPIGLYALQHPDRFSGRLAGVSIMARDGAPETLVENATRTIGMFVVTGDGNARHNFPGRPVFDPVIAIAAIVGCVGLVRRARTPAAVFVSLWIGAMLLPGILSDEAPHQLRTAGVLPIVFGVPALGLVSLGTWLADSLRRPGLATGLVVVVILASGVVATSAYLGEWPRLHQTRDLFFADQSEAAHQLPTDLGGATVVASSPLYRGLPAGPWLFDRRDERTGPRLFSAAECLPTPARASELVYLLPPSADGAHGFARAALARAGIGADPGFLRTDADALSEIRPERDVHARLGSLFTVEGFDLPRLAAPGDLVDGRVHLRVLAGESPLGHWQFFAHIVDGAGGRSAETYPTLCLDRGWEPGDRVLLHLPLKLGSSTMPGVSRVVFGLWDPVTGEYARVADGAGNDLGHMLPLASLRVERTGATSGPAARHGLDYRLGSSLALIGHDVDQLAVAPGGKLRVALTWRARGRVDGDYTVFVQLLDADNRVIAQHDGYPRDGTLPTSLWIDGETVRDEHVLALPDQVGRAPHRLIAGMYRLSDGQRLIASRADGVVVGDFVQIAP